MLAFSHRRYQRSYLLFERLPTMCSAETMHGSTLNRRKLRVHRVDIEERITRKCRRVPRTVRLERCQSARCCSHLNRFPTLYRAHDYLLSLHCLQAPLEGVKCATLQCHPYKASSIGPRTASRRGPLTRSGKSMMMPGAVLMGGTVTRGDAPHCSESAPVPPHAAPVESAAEGGIRCLPCCRRARCGALLAGDEACTAEEI